MGKEKTCRKVTDSLLVLWEGGNTGDIQGHLQSCGDCAKDYEMIMKILAPSAGNETAVPSDGLEGRIALSYDRVAAGLEAHDADAKKLGKRFFRPFLISAAAVVIVFILSFIYDGYRDSHYYRNVNVSVRNVKGEVTVNNREVRNTGKMDETSVIRTGDDSIAELFFNDIFRIKITCNSALKIDKAEFDPKNNTYQFTFNLIDGVVLSSMNQFSRHQLIFTTSNASIDSLSTEFLLSANKDKTTLLVSDGELKLTARDAWKEVLGQKDTRYVVTDTVMSRIMDNEDRNMIQFVEKNTDVSRHDANETAGAGHDAVKKKQKMVAHNSECDKALSRIYRNDEDYIGQ